MGLFKVFGENRGAPAATPPPLDPPLELNAEIDVTELGRAHDDLRNQLKKKLLACCFRSYKLDETTMTLRLQFN